MEKRFSSPPVGSRRRSGSHLLVIEVSTEVWKFLLRAVGGRGGDRARVERTGQIILEKKERGGRAERKGKEMTLRRTSDERTDGELPQIRAEYNAYQMKKNIIIW